MKIQNASLMGAIVEKFADRRANERITFLKPVTCSIKTKSRFSFKALGLDWSVGGIRLVMKSRLKKGDLIDLEYRFSWEEPLQKVVGRIVWVRALVDQAGFFEYGIAFENAKIFDWSAKLFKDGHFINGIGVMEPQIKLSADNGEAQVKTVPVSLPIRYRIINQEFLHGRNKFIPNPAIFIRLVSPQAISAGTYLGLEYKLPNTQIMTRSRGKVSYCKSRMGGFECGVEIGMESESMKSQTLSFFAGRLCQLLPYYTKDLECRPIRSQSEAREAFSLVYSQYLKRHYCQPNDMRIYFTPSVFLPESRTIVLKKDNVLVGTVSIIVDSPAGLPMEELFPKEIKALRRPGRKLCEVVMLALDNSCLKKGLFSLTDFEKMSRLFSLFRALYRSSYLDLGVTDLVINMNPKHIALYEYILFKRIGPEKMWPGSCEKPAVPMHLDYQRAIREWPDEARAFFGKEVERNELTAYRWSSEDVAMLLKKMSLGTLSMEQIKYFEQCYPGCLGGYEQ